MTYDAPPSILQAPAYGLLLGQTDCHFCHAPTPTTAVWVPSFEEHDDEGMADQGEGAVLRYIERLNEEAAAFVAGHAPWLRFATTRTSGQTYPAHHCTTCGAITSCSRRMARIGPKTMSSLRLFASSEVWAHSPPKRPRRRVVG